MARVFCELLVSMLYEGEAIVREIGSCTYYTKSIHKELNSHKPDNWC
jgi:hypothetical protein